MSWLAFIGGFFFGVLATVLAGYALARCVDKALDDLEEVDRQGGGIL